MFQKLSKKYSIFLCIFSALGLFFYFILGRKDCSRLNCLSLKDINNYKLKDIYREESSIFQALFFKDNDLLRVSVISNIGKEEAEKNIQAEIIRMKALFENSTSPYPGEISDEIECSKEFKPYFSAHNQNGIKLSYFVVFLNHRLTFGSCTKDEAIYKDIFTLFYCPSQNQLFQAEIITPKEKYLSNPKEYNEILRSMGCRQ